ncbi:hypothetical protein [uncultured Roseobacter sp.]|uniref:DUF7946 domain-containing protein n=1 Tax=uncultured Roseobacter sp. TaxID=114847 RepID=UPI002607AD55|nr:hypothetical protein [uncultured Roseobacter sp.]
MSASQQNAVQFYDVAQALVGFERTISLTTHLLLNGEVLTQSPAAKGFQVHAVPFEEGSWRSRALLSLGTGALALVTAAGVAPPDTAFGWLAKSAVGYVIEESLGFQPNFDETLGEQIKRYRRQEPRTGVSDDLSQGRFDSLIEKVEPGLKSIHRPLVKSQSANVAQIDFKVGDRSGTMDGYFSPDTFEYIDRTITSEDFSEYWGNISSYNTNTFKGRIFVPSERRTIPFELSETIRNLRTINLVTGSLRSNGRRRAAGELSNESDICFEALRNESVSGRLKSIYVTDVSA